MVLHRRGGALRRSLVQPRHRSDRVRQQPHRRADPPRPVQGRSRRRAHRSVQPRAHRMVRRHHAHAVGQRRRVHAAAGVRGEAVVGLLPLLELHLPLLLQPLLPPADGRAAARARESGAVLRAQRPRPGALRGVGRPRPRSRPTAALRAPAHVPVLPRRPAPGPAGAADGRAGRGAGRGGPAEGRGDPGRDGHPRATGPRAGGRRAPRPGQGPLRMATHDRRRAPRHGAVAARRVQAALPSIARDLLRALGPVSRQAPLRPLLARAGWAPDDSPRRGAALPGDAE